MRIYFCIGVVLNLINYFIGEIVCTQPRRLAARALASRVAEEFGCEVGKEVNIKEGFPK